MRTRSLARAVMKRPPSSHTRDEHRKRHRGLPRAVSRRTRRGGLNRPCRSRRRRLGGPWW
eukprot:7150618-Prymnesium_polylepis.2